MCTRVWWGWRLGLAYQSLSGRGRLIGAANRPGTQYWLQQRPRCLCLWRAGLVFIPALPEDHLGNPKERRPTCSSYCCTGKWRRLGSDPPLQEEESSLVLCTGVRAGSVPSLYLPNSLLFLSPETKSCIKPRRYCAYSSDIYRTLVAQTV